MVIYFNLLATLIVTVGLFIDAYFYPGALLRYFGIDSKVMLLIFALLLLIFKLQGKRMFPAGITSFNRRIVFPILVLISLLFILLENLNYETYVLGTFGFHFEQFLVIAGFSGYLIYINRDIDKYLPYQKFIYLSAPIFLFTMVLIHAADRSLFFVLRSEDHVIEYFQFFAFLAASILAFLTAKIVGRKNIVLALFSFVLGLGLLFIAGEEISWGQRIIGFEAPQAIQDINYQNELTVHNLQPVLRAYNKYCLLCFVGLWGMFGRVMVNKIRFIPKRLKVYLAPGPYLIFYFLAIGFYSLIFEYGDWYYDIGTAAKTGVHRWQEIAEYYMAVGFLMFAWDNYGKAGKEFKKT